MIKILNMMFVFLIMLILIMMSLFECKLSLKKTTKYNAYY